MTDELAQDAIRLLDDALHKPPAELKAEVDTAERAIVVLRDALIERLRSLAEDEQLRLSLDRVNAALSLVVGVEYPSEGVQRDMLAQARDALRATLPV